MAVHATAGLICTCDRFECKHTWRSKTAALPRICPKCKSEYWNSGNVGLGTVGKSRKRGK